MTTEEVPHSKDYFVSTDKALLDPAFVIKEIQTSYWGSWRSHHTVLKSIDHSLCFGVFLHDPDRKSQTQVGFARVVTDYCTFVWICDVVITKDHRHKGLGKFLMNAVMAHPEVAPRACLLSTHDAHPFYRALGFSDFQAMKRLPNKTAG